MVETDETKPMTINEIWEKYQSYINSILGWYKSQSEVTKRFLKYGGWIGLQFWLIRAPMTIFFANAFPEIIDFQLIRFPGYLLASFTSGSILAVAGFFLSEWWIWKRPEKEPPQ